MKTNDSLATRLCPQSMYGRLITAIARRLLPLPLLLLTLPVAVQAQYNYRTKNGTITITGYTCSGGAVTIPSTINSLPVTSIGDEAFSYCTSLTSVTIPNSVTSIGQGAFYGCTSVTRLTIPNSVADIGEWAFGGCTSLSAITVEPLNFNYSSVDGVLFDKSQTTLIGYPGGKAGGYTIPNSVTSIGGGAFAGCTSLTSVTVPKSVTTIGWAAFYGCTSLSAITVEALNSDYSSVDGVLFDKSQTMLIGYPGGKAGSYTIPNSVTSIGGYAFDGCTNLTGAYFTGDAPDFGNPPFEGDDKVVLYYLPGTTGWGPTGWGPTLGGNPTAVWNPKVQTSGSSFGVRTNQFGFTITWASDKVIVVEACADLTNPVWTPVGTNTLTGGSSYFSDPEWTNFPTRLYRLRSQ